jgi:hypothetical protein
VAVVDTIIRVCVKQSSDKPSALVKVSDIGRLVADLYTGEELSGFCEAIGVHCGDKSADDYPCQGCFVTAIENAMHSKAGVMLASGNRGYA